MVYVDLKNEFGPHRDASHQKSSKISHALHVSVWMSTDYTSSDDESGPWIKDTPYKIIRHEKGTISEIFSEMESTFDKSNCKILFVKELS